MVIEESSVVAAASNAAKFWLDKGGFTTQVISTIKNGQVHLIHKGKKKNLHTFFEENKNTFLKSCDRLFKCKLYGLDFSSKG